MKCIICNNETGSDKKRTCSDAHRAKASRMRNKTDVQTQAHAHAVYERDILRTRTDLGAHADERTVTPEGPKLKVPANYSLEDCECKHCDWNRKTGGKHALNHGEYKDCSQLADNEVNRVSLPGDVDYDGLTWARMKATEANNGRMVIA